MGLSIKAFHGVQRRPSYLRFQVSWNDAPSLALPRNPKPAGDSDFSQTSLSTLEGFFLEKGLVSIQHSVLTSSQMYVRTRISSLIIAPCTACH